jgi:hypothetical protein
MHIERQLMFILIWLIIYHQPYSKWLLAVNKMNSQFSPRPTEASLASKLIKNLHIGGNNTLFHRKALVPSQFKQFIKRIRKMFQEVISITVSYTQY